MSGYEGRRPAAKPDDGPLPAAEAEEQLSPGMAPPCAGCLFRHGGGGGPFQCAGTPAFYLRGEKLECQNADYRRKGGSHVVVG